MKLLVDMGNTRLKFATVEGGELSAVSSLDNEAIAAELAKYWQDLPVPDSVFISCVTSQQNRQQVEQLARALWSRPVYDVVARQAEAGVTSSYAEAGRLGCDRWMVLLAAHQLYDTHVCIVDCGTALTIDGLDKNGQHLGGVIMPGNYLMQQSLLGNTAGLSMDAEKTQKQITGLAADTTSAIVMGSWLAAAGAVEKILNQLQAQLKEPVKCVLTGGCAPGLAEHLDLETSVVPDLVLRGMAIVAVGS